MSRKRAKRIGFLVNPIAGMGGTVGLKGTDDVVRRAVTPVELSGSLERNPGIDSLARLEMALRLERRFCVRLAERDLMEAETPADRLAAIDAAGPDQVTRPHERVDLAQGPAVQAPMLIEMTSKMSIETMT